MRNPFAFFTRQLHAARLGVDIGTTSIKIVEVNRGHRSPRIVNYALLESQSTLTRANTAFQTSALKLFEREIAAFLKLLVERMKPKTTQAVASLPGFSAFTTLLKFPVMSQGELARAIAFRAEQYVPLPISEVVLDWIPIGEREDEQGRVSQQVLLVAVPQEHVRKYQRIFSSAGLSLSALEIEGLSLARSLVGADPTPTVIVDIGSRSTTIAIVEGGQLRSTNQSDFAGASLTQAIASSLNIGLIRAEELKRERGVGGLGPTYELSTIMLPFLDAIISEVKRVQFTYESQFPSAPKAERVILSGGGANLPGVEEYWSSQLGIPSVKAAPFSKCEYAPEIEPFIAALNPGMSVAVGLALREFS